MTTITAFFRNLSVALLVVLATVTASAQNAPIVQSIEVQYAGPAAISKERILANIRTTVGKPYSEVVVQQDVQSLYRTGALTNVRMFGEPVGSNIKVFIVVQGKATVSEVVIDGAQIIKATRIRKEITAKPGAVLAEDTLEADRQKIIEMYQKKGYTDIGIQYQTDIDEKTGKARVTFIISEGAVTEINDINFIGNTVFKDKRIIKEMTTKPKNLLSFFNKSGRLSTTQLDEDLQKIKLLYQNAGYADVKIIDSQVARISSKKVNLNISLFEGPKYTVNAIGIEGNQVATTEQIRGVMQMKEGAVFGPDQSQKDIKAIEDSYGRLGYADMKVDLITTPAGPGALNLQYRIEEGVQSYLERINITGNTRTKDKVLRRELVLAPGDVYDTVRVDVSKKRLEGLDYFEKVETYATDTMVPGRKDLNINVDEKRTGSLNFGFGFSSIDSLLGFAEVTQGNFDLLNYPNFTGAGQKFRLKLQYGARRKDFILGLTEPYFMDQRLSLGGELYYREADYQSTVYSQRNYGFATTLRKPLGNFTQARIEYRIENVGIYNVDPEATQAIRNEEGDKLKSQISFGVTNDTRDSAKLTRKGHKIDAGVHYAGGVLGGDVETYGFNVEGTQYFSLPWDTIFLINGEVALIDSWGNGDVPIFDRLYLGGANTLRGFDYRDVGPKDELGNPLGGRTMAHVTAEFTFPVVEKVRGAFFYDTGFVSAEAYDFSADINSNFGFGVRLDLPIGPIRIDYGIPIQSDEFNESGGKFNFNVGYQF
ncbi:MAG TPA: outer membrane protein assembly factor BamA [Chthoniobacterales bacterium]|jgi:outer membrane protein insertion porin family